APFRTQGQKPRGPALLRRGAADRERLVLAQAGHHVRHPQAARRERAGDLRGRHARNPVRRLRLPPQPPGEFPARAGRHLRLPRPGAPLRPPHRRHRRGPDPRAQRRRALLRAAQGQRDQLRAARGAAPAHQLRQPDPALPEPPAQDGAPGRRAAHRRQGAGQGQHPPHHRPDRTDRHGPARADRGAAAHRQDGDAAEHRQVHLRQPPRGLPHGAAHRRAAGGGDGHGAHGPRRGGGLHLRRAGHPPRAGDGDGAGKGQAPGRAQARRGGAAGQHHAPRPRLQLRGAVLGQGADRRRGRQRAPAAEALLRRGAQHRGRRLAHHHRNGADRHRVAHGRGDLRGVQGHRQLGGDPRPQALRQAHLPGDRHHQERHPQGRAAGGPRDAVQDVGAAPHPEPDGDAGLDGVPVGQAEVQQDQPGLLRRHEHL
ncbi:MAG: Transcription termination factor Rho, partial [uncultured Acetobacteraceae bacterium]